MRPYGNAAVSVTKPQAHGICDRCGFRYLHRDLQWQWEWGGPRLINLRILVCRTCLDKPQEQLRTLVLPPDPVPIMNPRPEDFTGADNPYSGLGWSPSRLFTPQPTIGSIIGNMTMGAGIDAAFDGATNKSFQMSTNLANSQFGFNNTVGMNWSGDGGAPTNVPSSLAAPIQTYAAQSVTLTAPNDRPFYNLGPVNYAFQGSNDGFIWTNISSGTTAGSIGETLTFVSTATAPYSFHRINFQGDGVNAIGIAQLTINAVQSNPTGGGDIG